jgi:hypothetical protein
MRNNGHSATVQPVDGQDPVVEQNPGDEQQPVAESQTPEIYSSDPDAPSTPRPKRRVRATRNEEVFGTPDDEEQAQSKPMNIEVDVPTPRAPVVVQKVEEEVLEQVDPQEIAETNSQSSMTTADEALGGPETQALVSDALLYKSSRRQSRREEPSHRAGSSRTRRSERSVDTSCVAA